MNRFTSAREYVQEPYCDNNQRAHSLPLRSRTARRRETCGPPYRIAGLHLPCDIDLAGALDDSRRRAHHTARMLDHKIDCVTRIEVFVSPENVISSCSVSSVVL